MSSGLYGFGQSGMNTVCILFEWGRLLCLVLLRTRMRGVAMRVLIGLNCLLRDVLAVRQRGR